MLATVMHGKYNITVGDGISIPCSYTSHVVPISAPKLHADLSNTDAKLKVCIHFQL